jgi:CDP-diglyceride synthetase
VLESSTRFAVASRSADSAMDLLPRFSPLEFLGGQSAVSGLLTLCLLLVFLVLIICQRDIMMSLYHTTLLYPACCLRLSKILLSVPNQRISQFLLIMTFGCAIVADTFGYLGAPHWTHKLIESQST